MICVVMNAHLFSLLHSLEKGVEKMKFKYAR